MQKKKNEPDNKATQQNAANNSITEKAHEQAEKDIAQDPDLSIHSPNDDLDEGESARLGEETGLI